MDPTHLDRVYNALVTHKIDGLCTPSISEITATAGLQRIKVMYALESLREQKRIKRYRRADSTGKQISNLYLLGDQ